MGRMILLPLGLFIKRIFLWFSHKSGHIPFSCCFIRSLLLRDSHTIAIMTGISMRGPTTVETATIGIVANAVSWKGSAYRTPQKAQQMGTLKWPFPAQQMGNFSESISTKMHFSGSTTFSLIP
jgi:hypothetical protein